MNRILAGAMAGCTATVPMTLVMVNVVPQLPAEQRYPIYPILITARVAEETGAETVQRADVLPRAALLAHFGYGTMAGAAFGLVHSLLPLPTGLRGAAFGLALFAAGYLGWLPALKILPPATRYPAGRRRLLIGAHVVWGVTADLVLQTLQSDAEDAQRSD